MNYLKQRQTGLLPGAVAVERIDALTSEVLAERPGDPLAQALNLYVGVIRDGISATPETFFESVDGLEAGSQQSRQQPDQYPARRPVIGAATL